jgi:general secretion pathway protein C
MRGAADVRGISLKAIDFAARLPRVRGALSPARASKVVTGVLAVGLAAAAVHEGLDIGWALGASALAAPSDHESPSTRSTESAARSSMLQTLMNAHLFGLAPAPEGRLAVAQRDTTLVLTGTIATRHPSSGLAIIGASAETANVHPVGDSLASGVVLRAVYRDHVIVERSGQLSAVFFPRSGKAALTATAIPFASATRRARGNPNDVDSEELQRQRIEQAIETESERTAAFVRQQPFYSDGQLRGIALEPGSDPAMLAQLGIKAGDVLEFINGSPIADPDRLDWLRQRLQSGQPVELSVIRPGSGEVEVKIPGGAVAGMIEN